MPIYFLGGGLGGDQIDPDEILGDVNAHNNAHGSMGVFRSVTSDNPGGPNIVSGHSGNSIDDSVHSCCVIGGYTGNPNSIGVSFTGVYGGPNDTFVDGTADYSAIGGGYDNICNGLAGFILSQHGRIYTAASHASLFGGSQNRIQGGSGSAVFGGTGCVVSSSGDSNGIFSSISSVISGSGAGNAIVGGRLTTMSGSYGAAVGSYQCTITAPNGGAAIAAQECNISANFAVAFGLQNLSYIQGGSVSGARRHAVNGDSQLMDFHQSQETIDAATVDLSPYGSANLASIPINTTWVGSIYVVARRISNGTRAGWKCEFVLSKAGSGNISVDSEVWTEMFDNITLANPLINPNVSGVFRVRCAGAPGLGTIYWSCRVNLISCSG